MNFSVHQNLRPVNLPMILRAVFSFVSSEDPRVQKQSRSKSLLRKVFFP